MKKLYFLLFVFLIAKQSHSQTVLAAGDMAIIGCNRNVVPYELAIMALRQIDANTQIFICDYAYTNASGGSFLNMANTSEGGISWTTTSTIAKGSVFLVTINCSTTTPVVSGLPGTVSVSGWNSGSTASTPSPAGGDNWFIYQGTSLTAPTTFVYGWTNYFTATFGSANGWLGSGVQPASNTNTSELPPGLTNGTTARSLAWPVASGGSHGDNNAYNGTVMSGTKSDILNAIGLVANWNHDETLTYKLTSASAGTTDNGGNPFFVGSTPFTVNSLPTTWNGSTWSNDGPDATTDALIGSSTAPSSFTCKALTINTGFSLNTTGITATVNGNITNSGNGISGTGTLVIAAASTLSGNALSFGGTLNLSGGTFATGGLLSIAPGGKITGTYSNISGNVTLQQSIVGQRGWRIFSNPFSTTQTISTLASTNGITINTTAQASGLTDARTFSNTTNTWSNVTGSTLAANSAYSLFIRGLSSEVTGTSYTAGPSAFTYKATGTLNGNSVGITPSSTSNFILVGNPYAAPVRTSALTNGTGVSYYVYTIAQGGNQTLQRTKAGSWAAVLSSSTTSTIPVLGAIAYKPSSTSSYSITAASDINTSGTLQTGLFRELNIIPHMELQVEQDGMYQDKLFVRLDNGATQNGTDRNDLEKFWNDNTSIYTRTVDNKYLGVDARSMMDSIPVGISALAGNYVFKVANNSLPINHTAYLKDNFLHTRTELKESSSYPFSITADAASKGEQRFVLEFSKAAPIAAAQGFEVKVLGNIGSRNIRLSIAGSDAPVSILVTDMLGRKVNAASNLANGTVTIHLGSAGSGMYMLQITNGKTSMVEKIIIQ